jgi:hypothetical protein
MEAMRLSRKPVSGAAAAAAALSALSLALVLAGCSKSGPEGAAGAQGDAAVQGGTLVYLEQQAHTNLYPPAGRLLSQRRHPEPDHRQADLPEPADA